MISKTKKEIQEAIRQQEHLVLLNGNGWETGFNNVVGIGVQHQITDVSDIAVGKQTWLGSINYGNHEGAGLTNFYAPGELASFNSEDLVETKRKSLNLKIIPSLTRSDYIKKVIEIQEDIRNGAYYEINYCMSFKASVEQDINPFDLYLQLNSISPTPFSCFVKHGQQYLIGASPERYLNRKDGIVRSQPIKGTVPRDPDPQKDLLLKQSLTSSEKEKAENLMIVDLVRNDLTKCSDLGSVAVEKLFQVDSYAQVHQLSSIISSTSDKPLADILNATFPMGSMTGAPKTKVMQRIHELEGFDREMFSGSIGYYNAESGDFDFNVNIRSIFYNAETKEISFAVGSAITLLADPESEWDECMLKAKAILAVLN